ncbi:hypothetical protein VTO42DRAFT_7482 [Malbranchea cinnamomea]
MARRTSKWALLVLQASTLAYGATSDALYKDPTQPIEVRVEDLLSRMTIEDKTAQLMQGDIANWVDLTTGAFNYSGLIENMKYKAGMFFG